MACFKVPNLECEMSEDEEDKMCPDEVRLFCLAARTDASLRMNTGCVSAAAEAMAKVELSYHQPALFENKSVAGANAAMPANDNKKKKVKLNIKRKVKPVHSAKGKILTAEHFYPHLKIWETVNECTARVMAGKGEAISVSIEARMVDEPESMDITTEDGETRTVTLVDAVRLANNTGNFDAVIPFLRKEEKEVASSHCKNRPYACLSIEQFVCDQLDVHSFTGLGMKYRDACNGSCGNRKHDDDQVATYLKDFFEAMNGLKAHVRVEAKECWIAREGICLIGKKFRRLLKMNVPVKLARPWRVRRFSVHFTSTPYGYLFKEIKKLADGQMKNIKKSRTLEKFSLSIATFSKVFASASICRRIVRGAQNGRREAVRDVAFKYSKTTCLLEVLFECIEFNASGCLL